MLTFGIWPCDLKGHAQGQRVMIKVEFKNDQNPLKRHVEARRDTSKHLSHDIDLISQGGVLIIAQKYILWCQAKLFPVFALCIALWKCCSSLSCVWHLPSCDNGFNGATLDRNYVNHYITSWPYEYPSIIVSCHCYIRHERPRPGRFYPPPLRG